VKFDGTRIFGMQPAEQKAMRDMVEELGLKPDVLAVIANDATTAGRSIRGWCFVSVHRMEGGWWNTSLGTHFASVPRGLIVWRTSMWSAETRTTRCRKSCTRVLVRTWFEGMQARKLVSNVTCPAPGAPSKCYPGGRRYYDQGVFHMLDGKCKMQVVDGSSARCAVRSLSGFCGAIRPRGR